MKKELRYPEAQCDMSISISDETDFRISVAHLREILEELASVQGVVNESVDEIINRVKKEI